ncbi:MAG: hypothetical protein GTO02_16400 [Candidatus Dadabacteria bacterium]|nr:hypothetical protein [Candidatus Dadabacteria bacterium]NIQ15909.1 hypothetical protein [Candidatus Dadabacteria bacterium]
MKSSLFLFIIIPLFIISIGVYSCGGGESGSSGSSSEGSGTPTVSQETVRVNGSIADAVASTKKASKGNYISKLKKLISIVELAHAQTTILEGIIVEVFDEEILVASTITDMNGLFTVDVPCDTPLTFDFSFDGSTFTLDGFIAPCPEEGESSEVSMTVSLDVEEESIETEVVEEEEAENAQVGCTDGEKVELGMEGENFMIDGGGEACIITAGQCELEIKAANVMLTNCSVCVDARGGSSVKIEANNLSCDSTEDGIRSVGNSEVEIELTAIPLMEDCTMEGDEDFNELADCEDPACVEDAACIMEPVEDCTDEVDNDGDGLVDCDDAEDCGADPACGGEPMEICDDLELNDEDGDGLINCDDPDCVGDDACLEPILETMNGESQGVVIIAGNTGINTKGNSSVEIDATSEIEHDEEDTENTNEENQLTKHIELPGDVVIEGGENSIKSVGNSQVEIDGTTCTLLPENVVEKGNAEVEIDCEEEDGEEI